MTIYDGNIELIDNRDGAPLKGVLDNLFETTPGAALKSRIKKCGGKKVTVKYKQTSEMRGIKTNSSGNECMTKLSQWTFQVLKVGPSARTAFAQMKGEVKKAGKSAGVSGSSMATRAGKGRITGLKWAYPIKGKPLRNLFGDLLNGIKDFKEAADILSGGKPPQRLVWFRQLSADFHRVLRRKLTRGTGGNSTIIFDEAHAGANLGRNGDGNDKDKIAAVVLAHELVHAYMAMTGAGMECGLGKLEDYYVIGLNRRPRPYCENSFRSAFSMPKRTVI